MAAWAKFKFFWETMLGSTGSTLTASSTATGDYAASYIYNMLETNMWKAGSVTPPATLTYDAGSGNTKTADYFAILGHNLGTLGASVTLQNSNDNFGSDIVTVATKRITDDNVALHELEIVPNCDFEVWSEGVTAAPTGWELSGAGATIERDAVEFVDGLYCAKLISGSATAYLRTTALPNIAYYKGKAVAFGAWVKASVAGKVRISIWDDVTGYSSSEYHTGGGGKEFLTVAATINSAATQWRIYLWAEGATSITVYFDAIAIKQGSSISSTDSCEIIQPSSNANRYWRIRLANDNGASFSAAPYITLCIWGNKTELDYASSSFDPYEQDVKATINLSQGGFVTGIHTQYTERSLNLTIDDADSALYAKIKAWWDGSGLKNFFVAWETANNPNDVWLMRPDMKHSNPLKNGGLYRTISVNLKGRKE